MNTLLTDIELDVQELRYLIDTISREPNPALRDIAKRNILQMKGRLDALLQELNRIGQVEPKSTVNDDVPIEEVRPESIDTEDSVKQPEVLVQPEFVMQSEVLNESAFEPQLVVEPIEEPTVDKINPTPILAERIKLAGDLRRSVSLNDSFRFSRELFGGDSELMNRILQQIGEMNSLDTALVFLESKVIVDKENEALTDFMELLKKYFN